MSDIIICRLDGQEILVKHLSRHLKLYHQKDYREYIGEHIEDFISFGWNRCTICHKPVKGIACSGECIRAHYSNIRVGVPKGPMSIETKRKLSDDRKQKYSNGWAPRVGKFHSDKTREKISEKNKEFYSNKNNHPFFGEHHSLETKQKMSHTRIERGLSKGENNPMYGKTHTPEAIRKIFSHRPMNKLEKMVADELDKAGIPYYFQFFIIEDNVCKSYDFKIKKKPLIIEVDGDFWHGNPVKANHYEKVEEVRKNDALKEEMASRRGYKIVRLWESDIKKDPAIVLKHAM